MTKKKPLIILEKADWEAKPTMAANTPAPVNSVVPTERNAGMDRKMMMNAIKKMMKSTAFLKKLYRVGSTFSFLAAPLMNLPMIKRSIRDTTNEITRTIKVKTICSQCLSKAFMFPKILISEELMTDLQYFLKKLVVIRPTSSY